MAGVKPAEMYDFYRLLHARGLDTASLAEKVGRSRVVVTRVLNGSRRRGPVWRKLESILTAEERALLDVVQCAAWNTQRVAKRPRWTPDKAQQLAAEVST